MSKAIRYDSLLIRSLAETLDRRYSGRGVRAVRIMPAARTIAVVRGRASLLWNMDPDDGFLVETRERGRPHGVMLPRGTTTKAVRARADDRTIEWVFEANGGGTEEVRRFHLWIELQPSRRAAALTAEHRVLASMGPVAGRGARYDPPTPTRRDGVDAPLSFDAFAAGLRETEPARRKRELLRRVAWTSPLNAEAILGEAAVSSDESALVAAWERYRALLSHAGDSCVLLDPGVADQPYPAPLPGLTSRSFPDLLAAFSARAPAGDVPQRALLTDELERRVERLERRLARLRAELAGAGEDAETLRRRAELLLSLPGPVKRGLREITVDDWSGGSLVIELDPALDAIENAQALFAEARRRERAASRLPGLIGRAQAEVARLAEVRERVAAGEAIASDVEALTPAATTTTAGVRRGSALPYRRYRTSAGTEIRVGRGAKANDELTFHHSDPDDIWLHARDVGGAHVVLRWGRRDENPPASELTAAAVLAALHSRARTSGVVAVDWARRKYVRKPRGSRPGQVTIERAATVFVEPDPALAERLRID